MEARRFRFGEFEFDAESGELRRRDGNGSGNVQRLAPQPALLLSLLIERRGSLVTRDEIREHVWPGVRIDFDRSLHFCVRQIRSALGDSATRSRYIENLPRRGYRFKEAVEAAADDGIAPGALDVEPDPDQEQRSGVRVSRRRGLAFGLLLGAAVAISILVVLLNGPGRVAGLPLRIAVMPFRPPTGMESFGDARPIAEWILEDLTLAAGDRAAVIGPTSTVAFDDSGASLERLAARYELQYIVNGRFIESESGSRMLAELIRVSDGAHVWVRAYADLSEGQRIGEEISSHVIRELGLD